MPRVTIYLPDELNADARRYHIAISAACQAALKEAVARAKERIIVDDDREVIAARLRRTRDIEIRDAHDHGVRVGSVWARETATLTELEILYRVTARDWVVVPLEYVDGAWWSAVDVIFGAVDPTHEGQPEDFRRLDADRPFDRGFVEGARGVYEQVHDLL